jgi:carbon monoxide dehydrogenase subunit G
MASASVETVVEAGPDRVWAAIRDVGNVPALSPGFVVDSRLEPGEPDARVVTFGNGAVARELIVDIDDDARRLVWSVVDGPLPMTHHNASMQVFPTDGGGARVVWVADLLPHKLMAPVADMMRQGMAVMKQTMEGRA